MPQLAGLRFQKVFEEGDAAQRVEQRRAPPPLPKRSKLGRHPRLDLDDARGGHRKVLGLDFRPVHDDQVVRAEVEVRLRAIQKQHLDLRVLPCAPKKLDSLVARLRHPLIERHISRALFLCSAEASGRGAGRAGCGGGRLPGAVKTGTTGGGGGGHAHPLSP